jgi:hypothetical protein
MAEGFITRRGGKGGVDVSDATALTTDVLSGKTFYAGDEDIKTGTIASKGAETFTPSTSNQTIASGQYLSGTQTILGDADLVAANIKDGVTIFGVEGTLVGPEFYLSFDGVDDYVEIPLDGVWGANELDDFTIEITMSINEPSNNELTSIMGSAESGGTSLFIRLQTDATYFLRDDSNDSFRVDFNFSLNEKIKYEFVYNNGSFDVYANDILVSSNITRDDNPNNFDDFFYPFIIGAWNLNNNIANFTELDLYDFKIYNGSTLFLHYDMSEGSGTTLVDKVGNNDGTIVGATWEQD